MNERMERLKSLDALLSGVRQPLSNLSNAAAFLWQALPDINWAGFYLLDRGELWLGPFQGKPACIRIPPGQGVCGAALCENRTFRVPDVHAFPGHIACDAASRAEIVVPLRAGGGAPIGVLDIDSPSKDRFTAEDQAFVEDAAALLSTHCDFTRCGYDLL